MEVGPLGRVSKGPVAEVARIVFDDRAQTKQQSG